MNAAHGRTAAKAKASGGTAVLSYYRQYARQCRIAAQNAPNVKQRAELQKMVQAWSEFAAGHERMIHESGNMKNSAGRRRPVRGWM